MNSNVVELFKNENTSLEKMYAEYLKNMIKDLKNTTIDTDNVMVMVGLFSGMSIAFRARKDVTTAGVILNRAFDLSQDPSKFYEVVDVVINHLES